MNVLVIGSGGREHALSQKLSQSKNVDQIFIAPGNAGTSAIGQNVALSPTNFEQIAEFVKEKEIDFLVVGPEAPLVNGIVDYFKHERADHFPKLQVFGPSKAASQLEGSKVFAKKFMQEQKIPTARHGGFSAEQLTEGLKFLESFSPPYVLKADGLAAGKGVLIINDLREASEALKDMLLHQKFGAAGEKVVIEEYLDGIEMSVFVITDGKNYKILPEAKDYKRIGEADTGLNTGGMGAVSPVPFANSKLMHRIEQQIIQPTIKGLQKNKLEYKGFLFIGLMIVDHQPYVIEYNVRLGDPETEVILPRIESDLFSHLQACLSGKLNNETLKISPKTASTVMLVSGGYPEKYEKNKLVKGFKNLGDCTPFHAGTILKDNKIYTNGGRVVAITALGENLKDALAKTYRNVDRITFDGKNFRKDIGFDLI